MKSPLDQQALNQLFTEARTYNHYQDKPVEQVVLRQLWDLMKMGPTSANQLPARMVWCVSDKARDRLAQYSMDSNADKIRKAPAAVILAMDLDFHEYLPEFYPATDAKSWFDGDPEGRKIHAMRNSSLQGGYFIMAARALGLDVGPMSGFNNDAVDADFFADQPTVKSNFIATLGYGNDETLYPRGPRPEFDRFNTVL